MFTRLTTITGAQNIDEGLAFIRETVVPTLRQQRGYAGLIASADRAQGVLGALSLWSDQESRDNSESGIAKVRDEAQRVMGGTMTVSLHEEVIFEAVKPLEVGCSLLVRHSTMDPRLVDGNLDYFRSEILPRIKAEPGFMAVRQLIDRTTGDGIVGVAFEDAESLRAAAAHAEERRAEIEARGVRLDPLSPRVIEYLDTP